MIAGKKAFLTGTCAVLAILASSLADAAPQKRSKRGYAPAKASFSKKKKSQAKARAGKAMRLASAEESRAPESPARAALQAAAQEAPVAPPANTPKYDPAGSPAPSTELYSVYGKSAAAPALDASDEE
jgi:hypothetical protein